jgi:hypothetical protein
MFTAFIKSFHAPGLYFHLLLYGFAGLLSKPEISGVLLEALLKSFLV